MSIQRYGLFNDGGLYPMREGGDWVRNDDHKAALAEKDSRIAELEEALNKIISLYPNKGGIMRTMAKNVLARGDKEAQS